MRKAIIYIMMVWLGITSLKASDSTDTVLRDSLSASLLTCSPGREIYELYGHTAIRIQNFSTGDDWVFNYGMFDFGKPNFLWRFVKGETDYELGIVPFFYFLREYEVRGSSVVEQQLNLYPDELSRLWTLLVENYRLENRTYRYNFLYDNCTTRARDQIERSLDGKVIYPKGQKDITFRKIIHQYTKNDPWAEFGQDFLLGSEIDNNISERQQMFSPIYMMDFAAGAQIQNKDGRIRPLVIHTQKIVEEEDTGIIENFPLSPMQFFLIWLVITIGVCAAEICYRKIFWGYDILLLGIQGIIGCVITFLFFFSLHPAVGSNWLILLFNPLPLIYLPREIYLAIKRKNDPYHWIACVVLTLFMTFFCLLPQNFSLAVVPLALNLWLRSASRIYIVKKNQ